VCSRPFRKKTNKYLLSHARRAKLAKDKINSDWFQRSAAGASHYFRPLKYHGDGIVPQYGPNGEKKIDPDVESYYKKR